MAIASINPFAPSDLEQEQFLGWEQAMTDKELAMKTATLRLFNIWPALNQMEVEVAQEDTVATGGLIGTWSDGTDTTALPVSADLAGKITNYCVLKVENELVVVKSVDRTGNTIDVFARGYGGTTGAAHANTVVAEITGYNYVVGEKDIESRVLSQSFNSYYVAKNTVPAVSFTKEDLVIKRKAFGEAGQMDYVNNQIDRMDRDLLVTLNKSLVFHGGQKATATTPGMVVGLIAEAMTNGNIVTTYGDFDSVQKLNTALTASRNKGGTADVIVCWPANYDALQNLAYASNISQTVPDRLQLVLGAEVKAIVTKVGTLIPVLDLSFPDDKIVVCNSANLFWAPLSGFEVPGADRTIAQESTRNDQAFTVDSLTQGATYYFNSNRDMTILTGVTQSS